ncbi:MAG: FGGY-family carbohydrate kinase [Oscillospiraceae bacterium]
MSGILERLNCAAAERGFPAGALATDWLNGRRYPYPDETATGTITGLRLSSDAVELYQALVLASAFGLRSIIENLGENGLTIEKILATGGVSQKSPYVIQTVCDVTGLPVEVPLASQITALGAAIYAAVACGKYPDISSAQVRMCPKKSKYYSPDIARHEQCAELFEQYRSMRKKKASR